VGLVMTSDLFHDGGLFFSRMKVRRACPFEGKVRRARLKGEGRSCSTKRRGTFPRHEGKGIIKSEFSKGLVSSEI